MFELEMKWTFHFTCSYGMLWSSCLIISRPAFMKNAYDLWCIIHLDCFWNLNENYIWIEGMLIIMDLIVYFRVDSWGAQPEFCSFEKNETRIQESVSKRLSVVSRLPFIQEQLFALFDLVPGLEYCDVQRDPHTNNGK